MQNDIGSHLSYRNRRIGDLLRELDPTEGKATGIPLIRDQMKKNGSPEPVFYTDVTGILFLATLPCHPEFIGRVPVTKSVTKSPTRFLSRPETKRLLDILMKITDYQEFEEYISALEGGEDPAEVTKSVTKSELNSIPSSGLESIPKSEPNSVRKSVPNPDESLGAKFVIFLRALQQSQKREELLQRLGVKNQTKNFNRYMKPLQDAGWIEMTIPDKPNSRLQRYRLTGNSKKYLKQNDMVKKGLDSTFIHYGIRKEDLSLIEAICREHKLDWDWVREQILKEYHEKRIRSQDVEEKSIEKMIEKALILIK